MDNEALADKLRKYVGRTVRIRSFTRPGSLRYSIVYEQGQWPVLQAVDVRDGEVWMHTDDGVWSTVVEEGLDIELPAAVGTYDFADGRDQMEAVGTAIRRYGPTSRDVREQCGCPTCSARHEAERNVDVGPAYDEPESNLDSKLESEPRTSKREPDTLDLSGL